MFDDEEYASLSGVITALSTLGGNLHLSAFCRHGGMRLK